MNDIDMSKRDILDKIKLGQFLMGADFGKDFVEQTRNDFPNACECIAQIIEVIPDTVPEENRKWLLHYLITLVNWLNESNETLEDIDNRIFENYLNDAPLIEDIKQELTEKYPQIIYMLSGVEQIDKSIELDNIYDMFFVLGESNEA